MCDDFDFNCGGAGAGGGSGGPGGDSFFDCGGGSDTGVPAYTQPAGTADPGYYTPPTDYAVPAQDLGNLDYLGVGSGGGPPVDTGGGVVPGYGATDLGNLLPADGGVGLGSGAGGDFSGFDFSGGSGLPGQATLTSGTAPDAFSSAGLNYAAGPAGSSATPNIDALNSAPIGRTGNSLGGLLTSSAGVPGGASAAGGGVGGGSVDLSALAADPNNNVPQWSTDGQRFLGDPNTMPGGANNGLPGVGENRGGTAGTGNSGGSGNSGGMLDSLGVKNPLGTAIAAGGLLNSMIQSRAMSKALEGPTGQSPGANLAELAAPAMQQGRELAERGADLTTQGNAALRNRAVSTDPNATTLMDRGTGLTGYVGTGTLPPAVQAQLDQAKSDAHTAIVSKYASRGMPTDPARNSSLRMELQDLDRRTIAQGQAMAAELAKTGTGIVETGSGLNKASGSFEKSAADLGTNMVDSGIRQSGLASNTYTTLARLDQEQSDRTQKAIAAMAAALSGQSVSNAASNVARSV